MPFVVGEIIGWELLLVLAVVALLFGSSQLPKLARSVGEARKELRKGLDEPEGNATSSSNDDGGG